MVSDDDKWRLGLRKGGDGDSLGDVESDFECGDRLENGFNFKFGTSSWEGNELYLDLLFPSNSLENAPENSAAFAIAILLLPRWLTQINMVRKKDKIWEHVEELQGNKWKCKFCQKVFSGGAYRIKAHLSGITGHDVEIYSKVNHETQGSQRRQSQASLLEINKKKEKEFVDKMLAKCFVVNNIAFNVVQTGAFGEFFKAVAEYGATYKLPSYSTLRTKLIPESRKGVDEYVAMVKHSWDTSRSGCTMSDIWIDIRHRSFINLVAYLPAGAVFIKSLDVSRERKTGIYLKEIVVSVIESIGQEHVVQFITDNGSNFTSAGDMLIGLYPRMYKTRCVAHGIQLL
ncbi:uncharacterized protein LOC116143207 [Pistacia vera]|uniref:uncharacterized protein LOC116143207 n=1 Tax=Pistacia vera TaxID=55513 RepID=UPI0012633669|nr:uncharacterized protein LOC116143207 [Pistacia vera]